MQHAHGAAVLQCLQLRFGLFGAAQDSGELLGGVVFACAERVGEGVASAQLEVVQIAWRDIEGGFEAHVFIGEEPGVEAVEQYRLVARLCDEMFPGVVALPWSFDDDDPWTEAAEVHARRTVSS